jgi:hypothetical protein
MEGDTQSGEDEKASQIQLRQMFTDTEADPRSSGGCLAEMLLGTEESAGSNPLKFATSCSSTAGPPRAVVSKDR